MKEIVLIIGIIVLLSGCKNKEEINKESNKEIISYSRVNGPLNNDGYVYEL